MHQPKDIDWLGRYKNDPYMCYKRPTSDLGTLTDWKWGNGRRYSMKIEIQKKTGVAILLSDKIDFETKTVWETRTKDTA